MFITTLGLKICLYFYIWYNRRIMVPLPDGLKEKTQPSEIIWHIHRV